jgi:hypothetical protein
MAENQAHEPHPPIRTHAGHASRQLSIIEVFVHSRETVLMHHNTSPKKPQGAMLLWKNQTPPIPAPGRSRRGNREG